MIEFTPSNFVYGLAELDGRPAVVSGDDFTVRGGSNDASISAKRVAAEALSLELRLPHVRLLDGMSGGGSVKTIEQAGRTYIPELPGWHTVIDHLNVAPSVSLVLGSVAGFGAARGDHRPLLGDRARHGADDDRRSGAGRAGRRSASVSKEELGHADIHSTNGAVDDAVDTGGWRRSIGRSTSCRTCRRASTSCRRSSRATIRSIAASLARRHRAAQPAPVVRHARRS